MVKISYLCRLKPLDVYYCFGSCDVNNLPGLSPDGYPSAFPGFLQSGFPSIILFYFLNRRPQPDETVAWHLQNKQTS